MNVREELFHLAVSKDMVSEEWAGTLLGELRFQALKEAAAFVHDAHVNDRMDNHLIWLALRDMSQGKT